MCRLRYRTDRMRNVVPPSAKDAAPWVVMRSGCWISKERRVTNRMGSIYGAAVCRTVVHFKRNAEPMRCLTGNMLTNQSAETDVVGDVVFTEHTSKICYSFVAIVNRILNVVLCAADRMIEDRHVVGVLAMIASHVCICWSRGTRSMMGICP